MKERKTGPHDAMQEIRKSERDLLIKILASSKDTSSEVTPKQISEELLKVEAN